MAKQELPVNYKDDVLDTSMGGRRRYNLIQNDDGTVSLDDVTEYTQTGDNYGAAQLNASNKAINESVDKAKVIDSLDDIAANTQPGMVAGALALAELNGKLQDIGGMHFKAFSFVGNPKGSSSFKLFTLADIQSKYFPNATHQNCGCLCMNGDGVASGAHYEGTTWYGTDLYVVFSSQVNTQIRLTGLLYYCDSDLIGG